MATTPTKPDLASTTPFSGAGAAAWPRGQSADTPANSARDHDFSENKVADPDQPSQKPSQRDALQALLAFSALHEQVRRRKSLATTLARFDGNASAAESKTNSAPSFEPEFEPEFEKDEQFVLDEVLQLVAERAVAITGADGLAIALAENNEVVLRASAGTIRPDVGARIDRDSAFSGACFREAQVVTCDDTETDTRVNLQACRTLGARSMVAVPLCGRRRVIGVLEAFSSWPFAFNESDVRNLNLLAELVLGELKPEDEDRFAQSAQVASTKLEASPRVVTPTVVEPPVIAVAPRVPVVLAPTPAVASTAPLPVVDNKIENTVEKKIAVKIVEKKIEHQPIEAEVKTAASHGILDTPTNLDEPAPSDNLDENVPEVQSAVASETETEVELAIFAQQTDSASHKPFVLVLAACIVIGTLVAGGIWWRTKTTQVGNDMIHTETAAVQPAESLPQKEAGATPEPAAANPTTAANADPDAIPDDTDPNQSPATAQELSKFPRVTGIRHWSSSDASTVVLDLEDQVQYEAHRLAGPERIYFDLHDTRLAPELAGKPIDVGDALLSRIRLAQPVSGMTRIVLETKPNTNFSVSLESNPYSLLVEVRKVGTTPKAAVNLFPNVEAEKNKLAIVVPPPTKEDLQLRARVPKMRIVVDAGHGGWDLGTVGRRGLLEKDLVLEIAQRLGKLLESRLGMEVIYTRQDDNYIPLDDRAGIANQAQADLFISVHANYSDLPSARGVETYYTNFFSAPGSKESGAKDLDSKNTAPNSNDPRLSGAKPAVTPTLSSADLHERIEQSRRLAASVQRSLYGTLSVQNPGLRDRGVKEASYVVLTETAMPGILAEVSFVSSPTDEQKLRSDGYREQIAEALYKGIASYAAGSRGVKMAAR
jgi:N-acetylmuramoyl-L-alanine amidase/putative methionine-R-sulfoxide reductase with GAF domain